MGTSHDLEYLSGRLQASGCIVLQSKANEMLRSLNGINEGGRLLADEIETATKSIDLKRISIVGNSLGGLYARYAVNCLYNNYDGTVAGLSPHCFITIATPHLGIRDFTYINLPLPLKEALSFALHTTGRDLMLGGDRLDPREGIIYRMATSESFLLPLRAFKKRRAYANVDKDFVVPLATAAFISVDQANKLREKYTTKFGIVEEMAIPSSPDYTLSQSDNVVNDMILSLDSCGWDKTLVHFNTKIPSAHNKISALRRGPQWISDMLGFSEGMYVMDHAARYITTP